MSRRPAPRGLRGRSWLFVLLLAVGIGYAAASGHWQSLVYLLLRVA